MVEVHASDNTLLYLRYEKYQIPISMKTIKELIECELNQLYEEYGLEPIPVYYLEKTSFHPNAYAWYSPRKPSFTFSIAVLDGVYPADITDTVRHEFAHHLCHLRHPESKEDPHGPLWKSICQEVNCTPQSGMPRNKFPNIPQRTLPQDLGSAKQYILTENISNEMLASMNGMWDGNSEDFRVKCFLAFYTQNPILPKLMSRLETMIPKDPSADFLYAYINLHTGNKEESRKWAMQLRRAAENGSVLANYFFGRYLCQGKHGLKKNVKTGVYYLAQAARMHLEPALRMWKDKMLGLNVNSSFRAMMELIEVETDGCAMEMIPGKDYKVFVPFI